MTTKEKDDLTERVLLSLVYDVTELAETVEQVKTKVIALARAHGIKPPQE